MSDALHFGGDDAPKKISDQSDHAQHELHPSRSPRWNDYDEKGSRRVGKPMSTKAHFCIVFKVLLVVWTVIYVYKQTSAVGRYMNYDDNESATVNTIQEQLKSHRTQTSATLMELDERIRNVTKLASELEAKINDHIRGNSSNYQSAADTNEPAEQHPRLLFEERHDQYSSTLGQDHVIDRLQFPSALETIEADRSKIVTELLRFWHNITTATGSKYMLFGGTLLGQYCNEGFLPEDSDGDIIMLQSDIDEMLSKLKLEEYATVIPSGTQLVVRAGKHSDIIAAKYAHVGTGLYIDVTVFHRRNTKAPYTLEHRAANFCSRCLSRGGQKLLIVREQDMYPVQPCLFEGKNASCPLHPMKILEQLYKQPFFNCRRVDLGK